MEQVGSILSVDLIGFAMRVFWLDPYLWIHLAGLAALPIFLELCLIGLAIGDPILPVWLEVLLVAIVGIAPVLWMQWQRPFYIFSILLVALKPEQLTENQRRLLTLFKSQRNRWVAVGVAIGLLLVLRWLYGVAAIASEAVPNLPGGRATGLLLAAAAFLGSNLFLQVPVSVAGAMLTDDLGFAKLTPYEPEQIRQSFTLLGLQIRQILPPLKVESPASATVPSVAVDSISTSAASKPELEADMIVPTNATAEPELEADTIVDSLETALEHLEQATATETMPEVSGPTVESSDSGHPNDPTQD